MRRRDEERAAAPLPVHQQPDGDAVGLRPPPSADLLRTAAGFEVAERRRDRPPLFQLGSRTRFAPYATYASSLPPSETIGGHYSPVASELRLSQLGHIHPPRRSRSPDRRPPDSAAVRRPPSPPVGCDAQQQGLRAALAAHAAAAPLAPELGRYEHYVGDIAEDASPELEDLFFRWDRGAPVPRQLWRELLALLPTRHGHLRFARHLSELEARQRDQSGHMFPPQAPRPVDEHELSDRAYDALTPIDRRLAGLLRGCATELRADAHEAQRRAMLDYLLLNPAERARLRIGRSPAPFPQWTLRAPVPWAARVRVARAALAVELVLSPHLVALRTAWDQQFRGLKLLRASEVHPSLPLGLGPFGLLLGDHLRRGRATLDDEWRPAMAAIAWRDVLQARAEPRHRDPTPFREHLLRSYQRYAVLMGLQLQALAKRSLAEYEALFTGSPRGSVITVSVVADASGCTIDPPYERVLGAMLQSCGHIAQAVNGVGRVEEEHFKASTPRARAEWPRLLEPIRVDDAWSAGARARITAALEALQPQVAAHAEAYAQFSDLVAAPGEQSATRTAGRAFVEVSGTDLFKFPAYL